MNLSNLQQKILNCPAKVVFVESAAASGKTRLIVEKIKQQVAKKQGKVVAFTFTRAAAEEISERLGNYDEEQLFVGTIHSYCYRLLIKEGITKAVYYCQEEQFDALFHLAQEHLTNVEPVHCILCDEMQDCNQEQFSFMFDILKSDYYFCCYDKRQSIYRWNGARPELIDAYAEQLGAIFQSLDENYRNAPEILNYAKDLIRSAGYRYEDFSVPMRDKCGKVSFVKSYSPRAIARTLEKVTHNWKDWFVLCRTNEQVDEVSSALEEAGIPHDTFKRSSLSNEGVNLKLKEDTIKVLTIHASKGLEAKNVVVVGPKYYNLEELCIDYVAATRARDSLYWIEANVPKRNPKIEKDIVSWET